jgi:hypothetical protein
MCDGGKVCGRCAALETQVKALEQEVRQWKAVAAHLAAVLRRVKGYARQIRMMAHVTLVRGNVAPQRFHFMRGAGEMADKVGRLIDAS